MWQPYFSGVGWNPFMDGAWTWYPGSGYLWASAYPWGWMPYHYGNWAYVPGFGWGWQPGGWNSWHTGIRYVGAVAGAQIPVAPKGTTSTVVVLTPAPLRTVINNGSAGLGISRGSVSGLHHLNTQVAKTGSVQLQAAPQFAATSRSVGYGTGGHAAPVATGGVAHASSAPSGHASGGGAHR